MYKYIYNKKEKYSNLFVKVEQISLEWGFSKNRRGYGCYLTEKEKMQV